MESDSERSDFHQNTPSESDSEFFDSFEDIPHRPILTRARRQKLMGDLEVAVQALADSVSKIGNQPPISLQPYTGRLDKRSWQNFIREFNKVGTSYKWQAADLCRNLPIFLKSEAAAIYDSLENATKNDWGLLTDAIAKQVGGSSEIYRRLINGRKQRDGESLCEFAQALSEYSDRAFPDAEGYNNDMRKNMLIDLFINGLKLEIREHLRRCEKPGSMADAIAAAMDEEQIQADIKREKLANENVQLINNINSAFVDFVAPDRGRGNYRGRGFMPRNFGFFRNNFNFNNPNRFNPSNNNFSNGNRPRGGFRNFTNFNPNPNWRPFQRQNWNKTILEKTVIIGEKEEDLGVVVATK